MGPRELPAINVKTKIDGKKVSKDFEATDNTSVFANQIADLLETSDNNEIEIKFKKKGLGDRLKLG